MNTLIIILQLLIALGIYNVWIVRFKKITKWRGGNAQNMKEEFTLYGLPTYFMKIIGTLKILLATTLIIGIWIPILVQPSTGLLALLMFGAVSMHIKVHDPLRKSLPALCMLGLCILLFLL